LTGYRQSSATRTGISLARFGGLFTSRESWRSL